MTNSCIATVRQAFVVVVGIYIYSGGASTAFDRLVLLGCLLFFLVPSLFLNSN